MSSIANDSWRLHPEVWSWWLWRHHILMMMTFYDDDDGHDGLAGEWAGEGKTSCCQQQVSYLFCAFVCLFGFDCLVLANCFVGFFFSFLLSCTFVHCFVLLRLWQAIFSLQCATRDPCCLFTQRTHRSFFWQLIDTLCQYLQHFLKIFECHMVYMPLFGPYQPFI